MGAVLEKVEVAALLVKVMKSAESSMPAVVALEVESRKVTVCDEVVMKSAWAPLVAKVTSPETPFIEVVVPPPPPPVEAIVIWPTVEVVIVIFDP